MKRTTSQIPGSESSCWAAVSSHISLWFSHAHLWALIGSLGRLPVTAAFGTMHDPGRVSGSRETWSSQTRLKCSHFEVSDSIIIDLRTEHLLLWLLGLEKQASLPASEKPSGGAGDTTWPQQRSGFALELGFPSAVDWLPCCLLLCWSAICVSPSRKRLSRQGCKRQTIFNTSFVSHSSGSYFYYHYLFIDFYPQISVPFMVIGPAKQLLKTNHTNAEPFPPSPALCCSPTYLGPGNSYNHYQVLLLQKYQWNASLAVGNDMKAQAV